MRPDLPASTRGRLEQALGPADARVHAGQARVGATLALLAPTEAGEAGDLALVYTKRREDLRTHPGQVSFPGGRVESGEDVVEAALREAGEEIGLDPASATPIGATPALYVPPSRYWLQTVVAVWDRPHRLAPQEAEVAEILRVPLAHLLDPARWRVVRLSVSGRSWAWALDGDHVLWGATAMVTATLLDALAPGWRDGVDPGDLPSEREVRPWLERELRPPRRPRLADLPDVGDAGARERRRGDAGEAAQAGEAVAEAAVRLARPEPPAGTAGPARALVLAGAGGSGEVARACAAALARRGLTPLVVGGAGNGHPRRGSASSFGIEGDLPDAEVIIDGLVGAGLDGRLRAPALAVLERLRRSAAPIVAVDVPTGLHPDEGVVGDTVAADVTVAVDAPLPGLALPGVAPFAGEVVVARGGRMIGRLGDGATAVNGGRRHAPGWRE